ncbi:MAG: acetate--CoA ligase family protein, partial [Bacteroidetes bacterium]|nr:acetate--CoA ligase family protein [Bacteroidota bacterium]
SLDEISEPIDLAVILTPAKTVPNIMEQCGRKGIGRVIIESGGFGELGDMGREFGAQLKAIAQRYDMRFIGPNCIGIMNSSNGLATPFTTMQNVFPRGGVGIIAQSGGVALAFLNMFHGEQLGYSKFAAIGNKLNIDENDLLEYYIEDPDTNVICMYLESIQDGKRLTEIARRSPKPIVVHKANIAPLSQVIAQSHTEALANDDQVVDAAFRQAGIVRFRDMQNYLDFVKILQLPKMKGRNLAIVSRSGGHAVIAADAAYLYDFHLPPFGAEFLAEIRKHLRADVIRLANPLDLGDLFDFDVYLRIIEHTLRQENVDGIVFLHTYFAAIEGESSRKLLQSAAALAEKYSKPVALCISTEQSELSRLHKEFDFPIFLSPERAILALDTSIKNQKHRLAISAHENVSEPTPPVDDKAIGAIIGEVCKAGRQPLLHEALDIIGAAGLRIPKYRTIKEREQTGAAVSDLPGPYAVKVIAESITHKSDQGGVKLGVSDGLAVQTAVSDMLERFGSSPDARLYGVLIQSMAVRAPGSLELIVGGKRDPNFGPVVLLGHGGIFVEAFGRMSLRTAPLSLGEIDEMIEELPGSEIFKGARGQAPIDREALKDAVLRIAHLMVLFPEIDSIDVNPVLVSSTGAQAVDARIFLNI